MPTSSAGKWTPTKACPTFVDANVQGYAAGRPHPLREPCLRILEAVGRQPELFWTDAEVLQELLHRYKGSPTWEHDRAAIVEFETLMRGRVEPLRGEDVVHAVALASVYARLSARDLIHLAVMLRLGVNRVISADRDFDEVAGLRRLDPAALSSWRHELSGAS